MFYSALICLFIQPEASLKLAIDPHFEPWDRAHVLLTNRIKPKVLLAEDRFPRGFPRFIRVHMDVFTWYPSDQDDVNICQKSSNLLKAVAFMNRCSLLNTKSMGCSLWRTKKKPLLTVSPILVCTCKSLTLNCAKIDVQVGGNCMWFFFFFFFFFLLLISLFLFVFIEMPLLISV